MKIVITKEQNNNYHEVEEVVRESFFNVYMPGAEEHLLVHKLRSDENYLANISFIALVDKQIVGAIFASKAFLYDKDNIKHTVLTFGPLAVLPSFQRKGVGSLLVNKLIFEAKQLHYNTMEDESASQWESMFNSFMIYTKTMFGNVLSTIISSITHGGDIITSESYASTGEGNITLNVEGSSTTSGVTSRSIMQCNFDNNYLVSSNLEMYVRDVKTMQESYSVVWNSCQVSYPPLNDGTWSKNS